MKDVKLKQHYSGSQLYLALVLSAIGLAALIALQSPGAAMAGDVGGVLHETRELLAGRDPLREAPIDGSHIPYPLTTATLLIPLANLPLRLVSFLVTVCLIPAIAIFQMQVSSFRWWMPLVLLLFVPIGFQLQLIQFAPIILLGLGLCYQFRETRPWLLFPFGMPLLTKAQLLPILALPLVLLLLYERRTKAFLALSLGWACLLGISLTLRPAWPYVWWSYARMFSAGYPSPALAYPWLGIALFIMALYCVYGSVQSHNSAQLLATLILSISLLTPQRALYEAAALIPAIALLSIRQQILVCVISFAVFLQHILHIAPESMTLLALFVPVTILLTWKTNRKDRT